MESESSYKKQERLQRAQDIGGYLNTKKQINTREVQDSNYNLSGGRTKGVASTIYESFANFFSGKQSKKVEVSKRTITQEDIDEQLEMLKT